MIRRMGRWAKLAARHFTTKPPPKPRSQLKPVEPHRRLHERLEKTARTAPRRAAPKPCRVAWTKSVRCISRPIKAKFSKRKWKNEKRKYAQGVRSRGPAHGGPRDIGQSRASGETRADRGPAGYGGSRSSKDPNRNGNVTSLLGPLLRPNCIPLI